MLELLPLALLNKSEGANEKAANYTARWSGVRLFIISATPLYVLYFICRL